MASPTRLFCFRLCLALGCTHPDYLLEMLSPDQLDEWMAFDRMEPIGSWADDIRFAQLAARIENILKAVHFQKGSYTWTRLEDVVQNWSGIEMKNEEEEVVAQTVDEMKAILRAITIYNNGTIRIRKANG